METCWSDFKCFNVKMLCMCISWCADKMFHWCLSKFYLCPIFSTIRSFSLFSSSIYCVILYDDILCSCLYHRSVLSTSVQTFNYQSLIPVPTPHRQFVLLTFRSALHNCEKRLFPSSCLSVRLHGTPLTDCQGIQYFTIFRKSVKKIQVPLKPDKNNGYFTWRLRYIYDYITPNLS